MNIPGDERGTAINSMRREPIAWLETLNKVLGRLIEVPAALLVLAEVIVLLMGVTTRYVLHEPLIWSDELASILFLWLAMLGSIIAFQRGEHMRMTAIVGELAPSKRAFLDLMAIASAVAFLALVVRPSYEYASDEAFVTTPAMGIPNSWRAAALPIGLGLMLLVGVIQIFRISRLREAFMALSLVALVMGAMALIAPLFTALGNWNLFVFFVLGVCHGSAGVAHCFFVRTRNFRLHRTHHQHPDNCHSRSDGRRHEPSHLACRSLVRPFRPADRNDRHCACHG